MQTLTIRKITPAMEKAINYMKQKNPYSVNTNTKAIERIIDEWWSENKPAND